MRNHDLGSDVIALDFTFDAADDYADVITRVSGVSGTSNTLRIYANGTIAAPSHTTTTRDALTNLAAGQLVYNTTTNKLNFYNGSAWEAVTSA
tara:strand:- start:685 stop:963 length:279 start_codon:yes stop_codon:yes gene_type:complete